MTRTKSMAAISIAAGTAFVASLAMTNVANAAQGANPFAMNEMSGGYMQLAGKDGHGHDKKHSEGKCGEGKCGGKKAMKKNMDAKCGGSKKKMEGKCGEGKCGGKKAMNKKDMKEGKCGGSKKSMKEGKCGS